MFGQSQKKRPVVSDYEIWGDEDGAISIVMDQHPALDPNGGPVPYSFEIYSGDTIIVANGDHQIQIEGIRRELVEQATSSKYIMLIEVEDREVTRCTPCRIKTEKDQTPPQDKSSGGSSLQFA